MARTREIELNCEVRGRGPALVLVPGLGLDSRVFAPLVEILEDFRTCIAVDNRGAGLSDAPRGPYTIPQMARDLESLISSLQLERASVAGHSLGGHVALQLALQSPDTVAGLALLATSPSGDPRELGSTPEAAAALARTSGSHERIAASIARASFGRRFAAERPEDLERFVESRLERPPRGRGLTGQRAAARGFDARARLGELRCPTVVVHGTDDRVVSHARGVELARGIPTARLVSLAEVGHLPQLEDPQAVAEAILALGLNPGMR
ncbi:MAG: alpha/beta hydrolase [Polyangia bacterium]